MTFKYRILIAGEQQKKWFKFKFSILGKAHTYSHIE
jgi:hypothetical protein